MVNSDVLIVGYGPVGQLATILLAQHGHTVTVVERWPQPYSMPRAVAYDGEAARILAAAGVADRLDGIREPTGEYVWENARGQTLIHMDVPGQSPSGWPESTSMYQPGLEAELAERGAELPGVTVHRGQAAVELTEHEDRVDVVTEDADGGRHTYSARWVIGCDGANSFVSGRIDPAVTDYSFAHDWLICDVVTHDKREYKPNNLQICDPARPRTAVSAGPGHRRWEFMRVPGETVEELGDIDKVWKLLGLFGLDHDNATLERHAVYTTQARCADQWRSGRLLIAGDAAHVMPPFVGQGMCSGFRDAVNLAWKLHLVLGGLADEQLLDTYTVERSSHVRSAIETSIALGEVICQTDRAAAAGRDAFLLAARARARGGRDQAAPGGPALAQSLTGGLLRTGAGHAPQPGAGNLVPQARVAQGDRTGLFDDVVGTGFTLLCTEDPRLLLDPADLAFLDTLDTHLVRVLPAGTAPEKAGEHDVVDIDDVYLPYLAEAAAGTATGMLVRPDFYLFGTTRDRDDLAALVEDLRGRIGHTQP
ncbi:bifunctional 3-(3-hydroxy-phenyl)propionate/3-hydroxycinnamic acid hydroxylase (plasmid) [Streptomyces sp. NBC_00053]|uniref:bifunctional 3-(3-hydroxy-phenyl)propionate/3-hydroxycinnamic acid hydroxylase MhpA n=1 Tax=unclassified Streptomyces TaxID=2593676 RepID=UPI000F5BA464|nr:MULTISPECIES: bifunctional 3-(3-hydroxy-phenyl)propionate/3-hydroxycinnamic acid hydroxylase [unclassified Streptomyces]WSX07547.1 bifunctional 3-(3-hydroxy-phenyl)propionate/3-hydroxycinnamic acid hydroxylase [Streptomyces sp. NBC_00987]MCX4399829.1 bifunctional 3-(3-hydroxy-phenyl)propionate/3-hydroxycinnamic acid hydroxylase [Streptomyces sp. NBC_01767]MCX5106382.1 bifunctional 3-(3-hydroxy-phenyl)propionate/3-hydroxycinnamic acid hydroxylase [Streptomyces sp. NBC_00439]MCX5165795.1 bifun